MDLVSNHAEPKLCVAIGNPPSAVRAAIGRRSQAPARRGHRSHVGGIEVPPKDVGILGRSGHRDPVLGSSCNWDSARKNGGVKCTAFSIDRNFRSRNVNGFDEGTRYARSIVVKADFESGGAASESADRNLNCYHGSISGRSERVRYPRLEGIICSPLGDGVAIDAEVEGLRIGADIARDESVPGIQFRSPSRGSGRIQDPHESAV